MEEVESKGGEEGGGGVTQAAKQRMLNTCEEVDKRTDCESSN